MNYKWMQISLEKYKVQTNVLPTMKSQGAAKNEANNVAQAKTVSEKPVEKIDFSKVEIEPLFKDEVDFETLKNQSSQLAFLKPF